MLNRGLSPLFRDILPESREWVTFLQQLGLGYLSLDRAAPTLSGGEAQRIRAAADAARSMADPFVLCARAVGVMTGSYDMHEAVRRIKAFEQAGADLLYVPLVPDAGALERVVRGVAAPVNALAAGAVAKLSVSAIASIGVQRISVGAMVARLTHAAIGDATRGMLEDGSFAMFSGAAKGSEIDQLLLADSTKA